MQTNEAKQKLPHTQQQIPDLLSGLESINFPGLTLEPKTRSGPMHNEKGGNVQKAVV